MKYKPVTLTVLTIVLMFTLSGCGGNEMTTYTFHDINYEIPQELSESITEDGDVRYIDDEGNAIVCIYSVDMSEDDGYTTPDEYIDDFASDLSDVQQTEIDGANTVLGECDGYYFVLISAGIKVYVVMIDSNESDLINNFIKTTTINW